MPTKIFCGVDEAGRGPAIGPMVMAIIAASQEDINLLNAMGVKDSKLIAKSKRNKYARLIKQQVEHVIIKVSPKDIDKALNTEGDSLNKLEARTTATLINRLAKKCSINEVMIDLPDKNKEAYLDLIKSKLNVDVKIDAEYKADLNHMVVAAASILAKVTRDKSLETFEKKLKIDIGSGYPTDPKTKIVLDNHFDILKERGLLRLSWKTVQNYAQKTLGDF